MEHRIFMEVKLYDTIMVDTCHLYVCQNSLNVQHGDLTNYGLWLVVMCQCRFISCNKCTTLMLEFDSGGGCAFVTQQGAGGYLGTLYFTLSFALNLKLLKNKVKKEREGCG